MYVPCICHVFATSSPCICHVVAMTLPCLGVLASKQLDRIPGGISQFYAFLLEHIFSRGSFDVQIVVGKERLRLCVVYGGLMADEKALKEVHDYKGASGLKACMDCANMIKGRLEHK